MPSKSLLGASDLDAYRAWKPLPHPTLRVAVPSGSARLLLGVTRRKQSGSHTRGLNFMHNYIVLQ